MLVSGFVDNYMIWKKHGGEAWPPIEYPLDEIMQDREFNRLFDDFDDANDDDEDAGGGYSDGVDGGPSMVAVMIVVAMNLMTVISWANCCITPKRSYWLVVQRVRDGEKIQQRNIYTSDLKDIWNTGPFFIL